MTRKKKTVDLAKVAKGKIEIVNAEPVTEEQGPQVYDLPGEVAMAMATGRGLFATMYGNQLGNQALSECFRLLGDLIDDREARKMRESAMARELVACRRLLREMRQHQSATLVQIENAISDVLDSSTSPDVVREAEDAS